MELRQLRYFVETADCLNFSEAARNLFVSQSSLSEPRPRSERRERTLAGIMCWAMLFLCRAETGSWNNPNCAK